MARHFPTLDELDDVTATVDQADPTQVHVVIPPFPTGKQATIVERVVFVGPELELWQARTLERQVPGQPTRLLVSARGRLTIELARHSEGREPGTWHRPVAPS